MTESDGPDKETEEVARRLQGLRWYRVDFTLYGSVEVKAQDKDEAERKAYENYDWANHIDGGDVSFVEEEE